MLWAILAILLGLWALGFLADVAGNLAHVLLVVALVVLVVQLRTGRRGASRGAGPAPAGADSCAA